MKQLVLKNINATATRKMPPFDVPIDELFLFGYRNYDRNLRNSIGNEQSDVPICSLEEYVKTKMKSGK